MPTPAIDRTPEYLLRYSAATAMKIPKNSVRHLVYSRITATEGEFRTRRTPRVVDTRLSG